MRTLITCLVLTCSTLSSGLCQQSPLSDLNYETIEEFMSTPSDYDALMDRMLAGDETLTLRDCALLYYGYSYRDDYDPDMFLFEKDDMIMLLSEEKYEEAYDFCNEYMEQVPVSLAGLNILWYACYMTERTDEFEKYNNRFKKIKKTIRESGDGTKEMPYYVAFIADALLDIDEITQQMDEEDILDYKRDYDTIFFTTEIVRDGNTVSLSRIYSYGLCCREAIEKYRHKERFHFY